MSDKPNKLINGFTVVEVLIVLAITAMLLTAMAVCFESAVTNYQQNEDIFKTVNNARQALARITNQLRDANSVDPASPANECSLWTTDNEDNITYRYSSGDKKLYLADNLSGDSYILCDNVTAATFTKNNVTEEGITKVKSVQISLTVRNGDVQQTLSAAAVIRRNL